MSSRRYILCIMLLLLGFSASGVLAWEATITATRENSPAVDETVTFGAEFGANDGLGAEDILYPAPPPPPIVLVFYSYISGGTFTDFSKDIRAEADSILWDLRLQAQDVVTYADVVTLTWDLSGLPFTKSATLTWSGGSLDMLLVSSLELPEGASVQNLTILIEGPLPMDYGDAPDPTYPTLRSSDGARHLTDSSLYLGAAYDLEADGQPDSNALGDDSDANGDDEDGVVFTSALIPGEDTDVAVTVVLVEVGVLDAWVDFNRDGDWDDAGEQIFTSEPLADGVNNLTFAVPTGAVPGATYARFRVSWDGGLSPTGFVDNGEVEDYEVDIEGLDYGDAPDPTYPTLYASNGARHVISAYYLGSTVDAEANGQPNSDATGDDTNGTVDDEDGVTFLSPLAMGESANLTVIASQAGYLDAWVDFNDDGDWDDFGEQIFTSVLLAAGANPLSYNVQWGTAGNTSARFRFSSTGSLATTGLADDGEVEDYQVVIEEQNPVIDIEKSTNGADADAAPGPGILVGDAVTWTYLVANTGNVPLHSISVTDDQPGVTPVYQSGDTNTDDILDVGELWIYEASGTATAGQYENTGTAEGHYSENPPFTDEDLSHYFGASAGIHIEKSTNGEDADTAPGPEILAGDPVTWTYTVTNTGSIALSNISVTDDQPGVTPVYQSGDTNTNSALDVGETWVYEATGTAAAGQYENTGTAEGEYDGSPYSDDDMSHYFGYNPGIHIEKSTNGEDADEAPGPGILVTDPVMWTYTVTNTGNVPLENISVIDDQGVTPVYQSGDTGSDGILGLDETWVYEATAIATEGQYENTGTAEGEYDESPYSDDDMSHYFGASPGIDIEKSTNGEDADTAPGPEILTYSPVTWTYTVTNTGNVPLDNISVTDDQPGVTPVYQSGDTNTDSILDLDEVWIYEATGSAGTGQYENLGSVGGRYGDSPLYMDQDLSHYFGFAPDMDIEKSTNGEDADTAPGPEMLAGETVTWTYVVSNTGNVPLSNVTVTDDQPGVTPVYDSGDAATIGVLDVGEEWTYLATGTAAAGQYENIGTAQGEYNQETAGDSDPSHYFGYNPSIDVEKSTNGEDADTAPGPEIIVGETVTWTYVVTNTGNVPLTDVELTDNRLPFYPDFIGGDANSNDMLDVGETWTYEATGTAAEGQYENTAIASGDYRQATAGDTDPSHYFGYNPGLNIEKSTNGEDADTATGPEILIGFPVTWTYVVTNLGNVPLSNVTVTDDQGVTPVYQSGDTNTNSILDAGEVWTYQATGTAAEGQYENTGTATGRYGEDTYGDDDVSHYFGYAPGIDIEKATNDEDADTATGPQIPVGEPVTWTYVVANTGNVPLSNVSVTDDQGITPVYQSGDINTDSVLDVGEVWTYEATGAAAAGQYENTATASGDYRQATAGDNDMSHYFGYAPGIDIEKATNGEDADTETGPEILVGDPVAWMYVVTNTGNVPLSNVSVTDDQGVTPVYQNGDTNTNSVLDVGEVWTYEATGTAVADQYGNTGTASGAYLGIPYTDDDMSHYFGYAPDIDIEKSTNGEDADTATGLEILVGDPVTWTYVVTNTGNVPLSNISVTDDQGVTPVYQSGDTNSDSLLDVDEVWTYEATGTAVAGQYENTGTVEGEYGNEIIPVGESTAIDQSHVVTASDSDLSHYFGYTPGIDIEKSTNGADADTAPGPEILVGNPVTWTYAVANTGNVPLSNITVTDDQGVTPVYQSGDTNSDGVLDVGEVWTYEAGSTAVAGQYGNTGTVTGVYGEETYGDDDLSHYSGLAVPGIHIEKSTNGQDADEAPGPEILTGEPVTWTYVVTNTGNVPLNTISVTDDQGVTPVYQSGDTNSDGVLDLSEVWTYEASGTAVSAQYENTGTATGWYLESPYSDIDLSHYSGLEKIQLISASYDIIKMTLTLKFKKPFQLEELCLDCIGMELNDSGLWDFQLSKSEMVRLTYEQKGPTEIVIYMLTDYVNTVNLAAARLMKRHNVDILLCEGAIKDVNGVENKPVTFGDNIELVITARGHVLGVPCDVTGDGKVSAHDALLILRATVEPPADVFPVYDTVSEINDYFEAYGYSGDAMLCMADPSGNGVISAYDAALAIQKAVGVVALAPALGSADRSCKLTVDDCADGKLDVSIDLNDVRGIYSADIVMTYNPELLKVADVSGTAAVSGWLFEHGISDTGQLRLSLAGISEPSVDGAIVTISFDVNGSRDAVRQLEIAEFRLNEGMLKTEVQNLPKAFALLQNYPNPFNPETWIPYQLSEPANVVVTIYSVSGQVVKRLELGVRMPDSYVDKSKAAYWDGTNQFGEQVSSGIYFYQLQAGSDSSVGKMIIAK